MREKTELGKYGGTHKQYTSVDPFTRTEKVWVTSYILSTTTQYSYGM